MLCSICCQKVSVCLSQSAIVVSQWLNPYPGSWGVKCPPVHFCLCISKTVRDTDMRVWDIVKYTEGIERRIKFCRISTGNVYIWHGNRKYILGNQRKVTCPILNLPIKSNRHFLWLLSYFHGHLAWICCWHGFLMSLFTGSAIWLANKLRKWTEMYGLKLCLRNVRHPWRTRRFWYYIRVYGVLFIVLPRVCRCFVMHRHTKIQDGV